MPRRCICLYHLFYEFAGFWLFAFINYNSLLHSAFIIVIRAGISLKIFLLYRLHLPACGFLSELYESAVFLIALKQFFMCTAADRSSVKYDDLIGVTDRFQPVSDHDHRLVFRQKLRSVCLHSLDPR